VPTELAGTLPLLYVCTFCHSPTPCSVGRADLPQWDPHSMKGTMMAPTLYCLDIMLLTLGALIGASYDIPPLLLLALSLVTSTVFTLLYTFPQP
jgi:hypothetical protein